MTSDDPVRIVLPLPPPELSPNSRAHWAPKMRAVRNYRKTTRWLATVAQRLEERPLRRWETATVRTIAYYPVNRRRDRDNVLTSLKPAWDGLADAGLIINDAGLTHAPVCIRHDADNPRIELTIERGGPESDL